MSGESADAGPETALPANAELDEDRVRAPLAKAQHELQLRRGRGYAGGSSQAIWDSLGPEQVAAVVAATIFGKAFLETLGQRTGDGLADLLRNRIRIAESDTITETEIDMGGEQVVRLVVSGDLPDEARLALLDLDLTAPEFRGKELHWAGSWQPFDAAPPKPGEDTSTS